MASDLVTLATAPADHGDIPESRPHSRVNEDRDALGLGA